MLDRAAFGWVSGTVNVLLLAENSIKQVDYVLKDMLDHGSLESLTMEGNPSQCSIAAATYKTGNQTVVCTCTPGFSYVRYSGNAKDAATDEEAQGYLCQEPTAAVVILPTFATLRSGLFILRGPASQLARPAYNQTISTATFIWNGYDTSPGGVTISLQWDEAASVSTATIDWQCNVALCKSGGLADIANQTAGKSLAGKDIPSIVSVNFAVAKTAPIPLAPGEPGPPPPPPPAPRVADVRLAYSAYHLPFRFNDAAVTVINAVAGSMLSSARLLRIKEASTASAANAIAALPGCSKSAVSNTTAPPGCEQVVKGSSVDWLKTNCTVETNSFIPTSIKFTLVSNTCNNNIAKAGVLAVRPVYSECAANRNVVVGWDVVVGDPVEMRKLEVLTNKSTSPPCTAVLQATDLTTGEIMDIAMINASVQNCFDNTTIAPNSQALSCSGHGTCNEDPDPYDGIFKGCTCNSSYTGIRCSIKKKACPTDEAFNPNERVCKRFVPKLNDGALKGAIKESGVVYTPADEVNSTTTFREGDTVHIAGVSLNKTTSIYSAGVPNNVQFSLLKAPASFFVSSDTGEISAYLTLPETNATTNGPGRGELHTFEFQLQARDELGAIATVSWMKLSVRPKRVVPYPTIIGCIAFSVVLGIVIQQLRQHLLARKDAAAALARAWKAYGLVNLDANGGVSINSGDLVINNAAFGVEFEDGVPLLNLPAAGYDNNVLTYEDDVNDDVNGEHGDGCGGGGAIGSASSISSGISITMTPALNAQQPQDQPQSKFVAPTMSLGKSTLAAKGLDVLLGVDPKTYMHVKRKVKVMLKEFAKNGTDEDNNNLKTLIEGTYKHPPNSDGSPLTADDIRGQSMTMEELMKCSDVRDAGLETHHVLALRLYTTSTFRSINNPMRQSPPVLPHPFAATMYYISDALSKLREVQGKDETVRNETLVFWRGMKDLQITEEFIRTGGSEMACMSTTSDQKVAEEFALSKSPLLFKFVSKSFMSHGASISFLSVYPGEKEVLYPPLTYLRPIKMSEETIGTTVYKVVEVEPVFPK
jgi:hypothetical protein